MKKLNETEKLFAEEMDMDLEQEELFVEMVDEENIAEEFFSDIEEVNDEDDEGEDMDEEDEEDLLELEESDDEDLFTLKENLREAKLEEDDHIMTVGQVSAAKEQGKFGLWVKITIPFIAKNRKTGEIVKVPFVASRSMDPKSRLYPILKGILGATPTSGLNLKSIEGKKVKVSIEHRTDDKGNVWENVIAVRAFKKTR